MKINGEVLANLILKDIKENIRIDSCESSWVIAEVKGFVVEVKISEREYWVDENWGDEPEVNYAAGVVEL